MFKLEICMTSEERDREGFCIGELHDNGVIETIVKGSLKELITEVKSRFDLSEGELFDGRLEFSVLETEPCGTEFHCTYSYYLSEVKETELDASILIRNKPKAV